MLLYVAFCIPINKLCLFWQVHHIYSTKLCRGRRSHSSGGRETYQRHASASTEFTVQYEEVLSPLLFFSVLFLFLFFFRKECSEPAVLGKKGERVQENLKQALC